MTLAATQFITDTQLWNAIAGQFGTALPLPAGSVVLTETEAPTDPATRFALRVGPDVALTLALTEFPFARLTGVDLSLAEVASLPPVLAEGLLLGAVEALRVVLPPALAGQLALPDHPGADLAPALWLNADIDMGGGAMARCRIGGRRQDFVQVLARLFPAATGHAPRLPAALLQGLSVPVALSAGATVLPVATVLTLEPGDVLLAAIQINRRSFHLGNRDVVIGTETAPDSPSPGWTVKEIRMTGEKPETNPVAVNLDDVPLTLRFVTEDRQIALADLQGLATGALLPFEVSPLAAGLALRIQANGVTIGEGHLVQIDDSFAVRIARMVPREG